MSAGNHENAAASPRRIAPGGSGFFQDGVVHGNVFQLWIDFLQLRFVACAFRYARQAIPSLRASSEEILQRFQKCGHAPEKHSGVPLVHPGGDIFLGDRELRLFREAAQPENRETVGRKRRLRAFDIAKAGIRARRRNSQHHHAPLRSRATSERHSHDLPVALRLGDVMIGGQHRHQRVAFCRMANMNGRQRDGRRGISAARFR